MMGKQNKKKSSTFKFPCFFPKEMVFRTRILYFIFTVFFFPFE